MKPRSPKSSKRTFNDSYQTEVLPHEILLETLLYSDIDTIVNVCTTNQRKMMLCNKDFFLDKFNHDNLPLLHHHKTFNKWVDDYRKVKAAQVEAIKLIKMYAMYNNDIFSFYIRFNNDWKKQVKILDMLGIDEQYGRHYHLIIKYKNGWLCDARTGFPESKLNILNINLNYNQVLYIVTFILAHDLQIDDDDETSLKRKDLSYYDFKQKSYLMGYNLIDFEETIGGKYPL